MNNENSNELLTNDNQNELLRHLGYCKDATEQIGNEDGGFVICPIKALVEHEAYEDILLDLATKGFSGKDLIEKLLNHISHIGSIIKSDDEL